MAHLSPLLKYLGRRPRSATQALHPSRSVIRENEPRTRAIGYHVERYKWLQPSPPFPGTA